MTARLKNIDTAVEDACRAVWLVSQCSIRDDGASLELDLEVPRVAVLDVVVEMLHKETVIRERTMLFHSSIRPFIELH